MKLKLLIILLGVVSNTFCQDTLSIQIKVGINYGKVFYKSNDYAIAIDKTLYEVGGYFKHKLLKKIETNYNRDTIWLNNYFKIYRREIYKQNFQTQLIDYLLQGKGHVIYLKENRPLTNLN